MNSEQSGDNVEKPTNTNSASYDDDIKTSDYTTGHALFAITDNVGTPSTPSTRKEPNQIEVNVIINPTEQFSSLPPEEKITTRGESMFLNDNIQMPTTSSNSNNGSKYYDIEIKSADDTTAQTQLTIIDDTETPSTSTANEQIEIDDSENPTEQSPLLHSTSSTRNKSANAEFNCDACKALLAMLLNFAMVIAGVLNIDKCEVLKLIPIFLIIAGSVGLVLKPFVFLCRRCSPKMISCFMCIISLVELGWMIFISYWVYTTQPNFDPGNPSYCNKVAYYTAFWLLTIYWGVLGLGFVCLCCACCLVGVAGAVKANT